MTYDPLPLVPHATKSYRRVAGHARIETSLSLPVLWRHVVTAKDKKMKRYLVPLALVWAVAVSLAGMWYALQPRPACDIVLPVLRQERHTDYRRFVNERRML